MAIGNVPSLAQLNSQAANLALMYRTAAQQAVALDAYVNALGSAGLQTLGFSAADATTMINLCNNMLTLAQIYQGTVQQGGTGGTGATLFNFQNALVPLTGPN